MKQSIYVKFIIVYALFGILAFFIAVLLGSQLVEDSVVNDTADKLYTEATEIAGQATGYFSKSTSLNSIHTSLKTIAAAQSAEIRVIGTDGTVLIDTATTLKTDTPDKIVDFDYAAFGPRYYEISKFYGQYTEDYLNVMVPVSSSYVTKGFISVHVAMTTIDNLRNSLTGNLLIVTLAIFLLSLLILAAFTFLVYRPMKEITQGAREITAGHLDYRINVNQNDEMGMLADSLNNMAAEEKKTGEYQRKFISNVSHDFRSPLTSIKGFTEAMTDGTIPPKMYEKYLKIISSETDRLTKLTQNTLTLNNLDNRADTLEYSDFDINSVVKNTAAVFEGSCRKKKISFELLLVEGTLNVHADKGKIEQVLYNLIDNAIKFSGRASTIHLETSIRKNRCEVSVKDEGIGISKEEVNKIFDRFYKADSSRGVDKKGTGLGLSIVKEILTAHNQTITVTSEENVGTKFIFTLALAKK